MTEALIFFILTVYKRKTNRNDGGDPSADIGHLDRAAEPLGKVEGAILLVDGLEDSLQGHQVDDIATLVISDQEPVDVARVELQADVEDPGETEG